MIENEDEYPKPELQKTEKVKKTAGSGDDLIDDIDSLKKLEPMQKGASAIKAFLNKKTKQSSKK